jgi:serine phosphatase RsbU (regulator of sigma subunit)/PAS domain-containing protein/anti-sigma regulatory factor (Ser/Thr protein kinase)/transcriptional regulator with GAF, ATPase, and Fis domain
MADAVARRSLPLGRAPRHLVAVAVLLGPVVATGFAALTWDGEGLLVPAMWFLVAVVVAALAGGLAAGLLVIAASSVLLTLLFLEPGWSLRVTDTEQLGGVVAFVVVSLVIGLVLDHLQTSRLAAVEAIADRDRSLALVDSILANAPVGFAFFDPDLRFARVNEALAAMNEESESAHLGRRVEDVVGPGGHEIAAFLRHVRDTGEPILDVEIDGRRPRTGAPLHVVAGYYPVRDAGGTLTGIGVVVQDVTDRVRAESERTLLFDRVARIQAVTAGLSGAATLAEVVGVVLAQGRHAFAACEASLALVDLDRGDIVVHFEGDLPEGGRTERVAFASDSPHATAIRTGEPVLLGSQDLIRSQFSDVPDPVRSLAVLPLTAERRVMGAIDVGFDSEREFDPGERAFLAAVAGLLAAALERARLFEAERAARDEAERASERVAFLAEVSAALASSLDWESTLGGIAAHAVPSLADWCAVVAVEGSGLRALATAHVEPEREGALRQLVQDYPLDAGRADGLRRALRTGQPVLVPEVDDALLEQLAIDANHLRLLHAVGVRSLLVVPLLVQGSAVGAISLGCSGPRRLGDGDRSLAAEVATRAGQAIVNARLFDERTHIAATLQAALLPSIDIVVPGLEVADRFVAGGEGVDVGGDFFDAFPLGAPDDRPEQWVVVIGDVRGKGVEAAGLTATARNTLRSISVLESSPTRMLRHLNEVLLRLSPTEGEPRFCTATVATVTPGNRRATVRLAVGGHPLPFVLRADASTEQVGKPGTLLGVLPVVDAEDVDVELGPGDSLVLFTDGVTERHAGRRFFDEEALASVLSRCAGFTAATVAERVETAARAYVEDERRDDLALFVVRVPTRTATSTSASTELPPTAASAARARRFVAAALAQLPDRRAVEVAELLTSEVVTNAVVHGGSAVRVEVETVDGRTRISVCDNDPGQPELRSPSLDDESGRGMRLVDSLARRWGVQPAGSGKCVWFEVG